MIFKISLKLSQVEENSQPGNYNLFFLIHTILSRLDNYLRGCCFAPDGLCILSNSNDNTLRLFNLPPALLSGQLENAEPEMESVLRIPEGEAVYDFCWWPRMNSMDPASCCFVSSAKHQPIHLFDAFNGKLRASYRIIVSENIPFS